MRNILALVVLVSLMTATAAAQEVVIVTSGSWQELTYSSGMVKSQVSATGADWSLTADKLVSAVPGPAGWQWETSYVNGALTLSGLYGINEAAVGLTFTNLTNNDGVGIPQMFELTGSGVLPSGMAFSVLGTFDASISGSPTVSMQGTDILVSGMLTSAQVTLTPLTVGVDIKPGPESSEPECSPINLESNGSTPIAILGTDTFDVMNVAIGSLLFEGSSVRVKPKGGYQVGYEDVNGDGIPDLVAHFPTPDITDLMAGDVVGAVTGRLKDGTLIYGSDCIRLVPDGGDMDSPSAGAHAIPEPASLALLTLGGLALLRRRR